ncbi:tetratricopeptide repeat protein [Acanthopleuribacter pedis]|uniref:protein O-GlcNAc transferase n=1 Tax=Acanthopleuribacter pedis TaxID=442870 RepID=A0A8J7U3P3_9BACT|nr:tetratricopeptide repeat protein [Acanthopleuribacter pedis]MBO1318974.1 tetratricopeptide repeat protein [Acanthopleuribacter pedis]
MSSKSKKRDKKKKKPAQPPRKIYPEKAEAQYREAAVAYQRGDMAQAEGFVKKALALDPGNPGSLNLKALFHCARGEISQGLNVIKRALAIKPSSHFYHNTRGNLLVAREDWDEALQAYRAALRFEPGFVDAQANLGYCLLRAGRLGQSKTALEKALAANRDHFDALSHYGRYHMTLGDYDAAGKYYERAHAVAPNHAMAHGNLGLIEALKGRLSEALVHYQKSLSLEPRAEVHNNTGNCLKELKRYDEAAAQFRLAVTLDPSYVKARANLGDLLQDQGDWQAARAEYQAAFEQSGAAWYLFKAVTVLPVIAADAAEIESAHAAMRAGLSQLETMDLNFPEPLGNLNRTLFFLAYGGAPVRDLQCQAARVLRRACPALSYRAEHVAAPTPRQDGRIAVGFISRYLRNHTIGRLYRHLISGLPRDRFHVTLFVHEQSHDDLVQGLAAEVDQTLSFPSHLARARDVVAGARCDLLFYLDIGMDIGTYLLAFMRLAPIQLATIGHPVTSGIETIDYFVSSRGMEPENAAEHYSEELLLTEVPAMVIEPPRFQTKTRADFGLDPAGRYFVCPQSLFKFHPDYDPILRDLLAADEKAELLLIEGAFPRWRTLLMQRWARTLGDLTARIRWLPRMSQSDFVSLIQLADVMLDPHHFGGGMTSYEALSVGTPVVTRPGSMMCGRVTDAMYRRIGLTGLTVADDAAYVARATTLAADPGAREAVVAEMTRLKDAAFMDGEAVAQVAELLRSVYERGPRPRELW